MAGTSFRQRIDQIVYRKPVGRRRRRRRSTRPSEDHVQQFHKRHHEIDRDAYSSSGQRVLQRSVRMEDQQRIRSKIGADQATDQEEKRAENRENRPQKRYRERTGIVTVVQLGPTTGPRVRDDEGKIVGTKRR